jgi:hypothetical protein
LRADLELCAGVPEPELRHILPVPELENSGKNSGRQNYNVYLSYFNEHLALNGKIKLLFTNILLFICCFTIYYYVVYY